MHKAFGSQKGTNLTDFQLLSIVFTVIGLVLTAISVGKNK